MAEVISSSRELYPLTKNYPMGLLPVGAKKLIVYQLESLAALEALASKRDVNKKLWSSWERRTRD
jgi:hypothetical protein